ncbi:hypothetical protein FQR65_LT10602 [Abscondita terminalis]|nr:hypothetical protein FQR65_LT10602 [Abscondita terminalis]
MVNSGSFDSDVDRNEKDGFTQYNHVVESPQSVISMHAVSGSLCENDFSTQTADSLPVSQAIEPTATKTEYKCNMSEDIVRVSDNLELKSGYKNSGDENKCIKETCITTQSNTTQSFIAGEPFVVDRYINTGYLRKYKIETKPSICCSVPLERIPNVLKTCSNIIANRTLSSYHNNKEISKKEMCLYCDRSFLIPSMKQKHMNRSHLLKCNKRINHKLLKCLYCDLDSSECNSKQLFAHLATKHSEKYFACLQCEMRFPNVQILDNHKSMLHSSFLRLDANALGPNKIEEKKENETIMRDPISTIKTRIEYKRNIKTSETLSNLETTPKTKRKCQSKYLHNTKPKESSDPPTISYKTSGNDNKMKSKYVKDLRKKKLSVISTKVGVKLGLRITRQRSKILENAKNSRKKPLPEIPTQKESTIVSTKFLPPYQTNSLSFFDISYRVKKITDHSIDNLRISSLTFNDVFDKAFFNRVKCNIQENLLNYIDGKLFKSIESENRISSFQKTKDVSLEECNNSCGISNTISNTSEASSDTQFSEDSESQVDKSSKKKNSSEETGNYKYFTRRKYQAVISERKGNKDLSKLDIWTQLIMKNRQQKILSDQKTEKELLEYKKTDEYKTKMQREELNGILDKRGPLEDLKEEAMRTVALEKINSTSNESNIDTYFDVTIILNEILNNLFPKENNLAVSDKENCHLENTHEFSVEQVPQGEELLSMFNLQRISYSSRVNAIENVLNSDIDKTAIVELTGEWARTRIYICASCGIKLPNAKLPVINKNVIKTSVKPSKKENKVVAKTSVTVTNRTRRLLRSNSSILLDNKRSLILTKFKRKKKEKKKIVKRRHLKAQPNSVQQHFLKNNPIVATCKLTDDQIKNFVKPDGVHSSNSDLVTIVSTDDNKLDDHTEKSEVEDSQVMTPKENTLLSDDVTVDQFNYNKTEAIEEPKPEIVNVTKPVRVIQKKKKIKKAKATENVEKKKIVSMKKFRNNNKVNHISSIKTRKMHLRNAANPSKQTNRKNLAKPTLTEIVQVDGSPHSKPACKSKVAKKDLNEPLLNCSSENISTVTVNDPSSTVASIVTTENDDALVINTLDDKETEPTPTIVDSCVEKVEVTEEIQVKDEIEDIPPPSSLTPDLAALDHKDCNDKLLIKIPPATKKGPKKTRGLNDCIAMLTNKLQDKSLSPTNNVLEAFSLKSFETSINGLLNKSTVNGISNCNTLSEYVETHVTEIDEVQKEPKCNSLIKPNGFYPNGIHKDISNKLIPENDATVEIIEQKSTDETTNFEQCFEELQQPSIDIHNVSDIPEQETTKEFDELKVNKHKVKHKRKETRKRRLFGNVSVLTNDKLQEIQDSNTLLNGTKNNCEFSKSATENVLKQDTDSANNLDKFSASEKENSFNPTIIKIIKSRKSKRKVEKEVLADVEVVKPVEVSISRNHVDDIIDAVAMNEFVDSEDELPLSELAKKYVVELKAEDGIDSPKPVTVDNSTLIEPLIVINNVVEESTVVPEESMTHIVNMEVTSEISKLQKKHVKRKKRRKVETDITKTDTVTTEESVQAVEVTPDVAEEDSCKTPEEELKVDSETIIDAVLDSTLSSPSKLTSENSVQQPEETSSILNESETAENVLDPSASNDSGLISKSEIPVKKKRGRKPKALTTKVMEKIDSEPSSAYCDICNKTFRRSENLLKHKRTFTHIAKLSELEALQQEQSKLNGVIETKNLIENVPDENKTNDVQTSLQNIDSVACDEFPENNKEADFVAIGPPQESLQLVDIINDVLSKPVDSDFVEHRNFSNLILQSDPEIKRCKSLGERKSFDCDKLPIIDNSNASPIPIETNISGSTADVIVEKQISLLENMIEDNRNTLNTSQKVFDPSKIPITEDYSCQSNSSAFSILSSSKQEDLNEITFTHNTNIITNLIKPNLEDNLMSTVQYEQISDDSNSSHLQIEEQKSRKVLNRDEELFLECCSLLKSSSDVSDLCRKTSKPTKFLNNFGLKPMDELEWLEQKQLPMKSAILQPPINNTIEIPQTNASVHENFYNDVPYSNFETRNLKVYLEKTENDNLYSRPPIFEDISTESDGSSQKSVPNVKSSDQTGFSVELNHDDRSSPNVESAQVPFEEEKASVEDRTDDVESLDKDDFVIANEISSSVPKKPDGGKTIQTNIMDYVVAKKIKKHENKKLLTKGALKVFEGLKVSIPKVELDMKEVLSCSPTSKRLEIEAEQGKLEEKKLNNKKESTHRNFLFNKIIKNGKKINNKLGLKITKKRYNVDAKFKQIHHEITKKSHDVYDFEETQDSVDIFIKNSDSLPDYHSFKNKITNKCDEDDFDYDDDFAPKSPKDDCKKLNKNSYCLPPNILPSSRKLKMNKCITKKKCMIMGRIFKNALKSKMSEDIKDIPVMDNTKIVEDFVMNCHDMQLNHKNQKSKLSEEEMNMLFDSLLNDDNMNNSLSKCKSENTPESELNSISVKHTDKLKQRMKCKKRQRANSPDSSDEEFSIKKMPKKHLNKKTNVNNCVINLEQELKECIGVASRKSQRKCTSGKQNVLVEYWSSDESNFDFESVNSTVQDSQQVITKELTSAPVQEVDSVVEVIEKKCDEVPQVEEKKEVKCDKVKETKTPSLKSKHLKKRKIVKPYRDVNGSSVIVEDKDSVTIASTRQKRNAVDTLYYWSSSSEDEMVDIIDLKAIREDCVEDDRPLQQGWIVGDSPKKLVTMLAQAKGKKLDIEYVKKNRKKRTSV